MSERSLRSPGEIFLNDYLIPHLSSEHDVPEQSIKNFIRGGISNPDLQLIQFLERYTCVPKDKWKDWQDVYNRHIQELDSRELIPMVRIHTVTLNYCNTFHTKKVDVEFRDRKAAETFLAAMVQKRHVLAGEIQTKTVKA